MVDYDYLIQGLNALARAHQVNTMSGHLGAAVVSGYFIAEQHPDLDAVVYDGIEGELDRVIAGESVFSPRKSAAIDVKQMFAPFPAGEGREGLIDGIAEALSENIDETRQSGHNVIFASIAIRALKDHPDLATPAIVDGIRKLTRGFNGEKPGSGYYGKEKGRIDGRKIQLPEDDGVPMYDDLPSMARVVFQELIAHAFEHRQGFGGLWHVINHAAALAELNFHGYEELAQSGVKAHRQHLRLWNTVPDVTDELGAEKKASHDPHSAEYWTSEQFRRDRALLTHRVKTIYGFDMLMMLIDDQPLEEQARDEFRYLIA